MALPFEKGVGYFAAFNAITACPLTINDETVAAFLDRSYPRRPGRSFPRSVYIGGVTAGAPNPRAWAGSPGAQPPHPSPPSRSETTQRRPPTQQRRGRLGQMETPTTR